MEDFKLKFFAYESRRKRKEDYTIDGWFWRKEMDEMQLHKSREICLLSIQSIAAPPCLYKKAFGLGLREEKHTISLHTSHPNLLYSLVSSISSLDLIFAFLFFVCRHSPRFNTKFFISSSLWSSYPCLYFKILVFL